MHGRKQKNKKNRNRKETKETWASKPGLLVTTQAPKERGGGQRKSEGNVREQMLAGGHGKGKGIKEQWKWKGHQTMELSNGKGIKEKLEKKEKRPREMWASKCLLVITRKPANRSSHVL
jgi:hypothetical protein